jgi:hypothetical protein
MELGKWNMTQGQKLSKLKLIGHFFRIMSENLADFKQTVRATSDL